VDLEQREGRVNRYKGHLIRRNVAGRHGHRIGHDRDAGDDPWETLFAHAEREFPDDQLGLRPFWIYETDSGPRLQRCIPALPYSQDRRMLGDLKRTLVFYRMVFGQPRQQDLIEYLRKRYEDLTDEELLQLAQQYSIDLQPPDSR
jgi:hypothetical protein